MMKILQQLDARQQRLTALGLLLLIVLLVLGVIFHFCWKLDQHYSQAIKRYSDEILLYHQRMINKPVLNEEINALSERLASSGQLMTQEVSAAGAALQEIIRRVIAQSNGEVLRSQQMQGRDEGAFSSVFVSVDIFMSMSDMESLFNRIYAMQPTIFIEELQIKPVFSQPSGVPADWQSGEVNLTLVVKAYLRNPHPVAAEEVN